MTNAPEWSLYILKLLSIARIKKQKSEEFLIHINKTQYMNIYSWLECALFWVTHSYDFQNTRIPIWEIPCDPENIPVYAPLPASPTPTFRIPR